MSTTLVDSHCHLDRLDLSKYENGIDGALDFAREQGVGHFLCVCIDLGNFSDVLDFATRYDNIDCSVGVHPNEQGIREPTVAELVELAADPHVVAIGETGLDYFRSEGDLEWQRARFRTHIAAAKQAGKPLIVHSREAREDTLTLLAEEGADQAGGVMHCFVEDWDTARRAMELGFYISFSGIVTFNSAKTLQEVAAKVPDDRLLIETDSPYLAPVPHRGKPNQPAFVRHVAEFIAKLRGTDLDTVARISRENYFRLFHGGTEA